MPKGWSKLPRGDYEQVILVTVLPGFMCGVLTMAHTIKNDVCPPTLAVSTPACLEGYLDSRHKKKQTLDTRRSGRTVVEGLQVVCHFVHS